MLPTDFQDLLRSPEALIETVWSRQDYAGIVKRNRLLVITGYSYTPPLPKKPNDVEEPKPRLWLVGYTSYDDGTTPRPFSVLIDSLFNEQRYRQTDMTADPRTGKTRSIVLKVHKNETISPRKTRARVVEA